MDQGNTKSILFLNPDEYFHAAVSGAIENLGLRATDHAKVYLVKLLGHYMFRENLFPMDTEGKAVDTLAQQFALALEEEKEEAREFRLRQMGDFSLYIAGFFSPSLKRKPVDVDYYIGMGEAAYQNVASLQSKRSGHDLFLELSKKFSSFVDVLGQISEESGFNTTNDKDLLRLYDLWLKTGSDRLAKQLAKAGIVAASRPKEPTGGDS
ncbi:MAG: hypothetical protein M9962_14730 [Oligoflexia bacterium]|nr:hypothetical protein [Oligoflexia bacterium]